MLDGGRSDSDRCLTDATKGRNGSLTQTHGAGDTGQPAWVVKQRATGCAKALFRRATPT